MSKTRARLMFLCAAFVIALQGPAPAQSDWLTYRHDFRRSGAQPAPAVGASLSNYLFVRTLHCAWSFPADGQCGAVPPAAPAGPFWASPIVVENIVFIGDTNGVFYALDAATGAVKWRYPKTGNLAGSCTLGGNGTWGRYGIRSSASYANIGGEDAVIFGAPDPDSNTDGGAGSARLFALPLSADPNNPQPIWKSDVVAHVDCTAGDAPTHGRVAYSSPLVLGNKVYVGVHDAGDDPIQNGEVVAVDINTGHIDNTFHFVSTGARGGGVWNSPATDGTGIYFTTGNTRCWNGGCQAEPHPNHGLSMLRVDTHTGNVVWPFQPVPYNLDDDPDWAAGAALASASCGDLVASVQKDGWAYALNAADGTLRWQFPNTGLSSPDFLAAPHGDDDYKMPGAVWKDTLILTTGSEALVHDGAGASYARLHSLNLCASVPRDVVRWIADLGPPSPFSSGGGYSLGAPTVTGGFIYIGTDLGHLLILADPDVLGHPLSERCSNPDIPSDRPDLCDAAGYKVVDNLYPRFDLRLPDGGNLVGLRKEVVLSDDRVFVSTAAGHVYMLATARLVLTGTPELLPGQTGSATVALSRPAPAGGAVVTVASDPSLFADLPASVTVPAGQTTTDFAFRDAHTGAETGGRIFASFGGETAAALVQFIQPPQTCDLCTSPRQCCICSGGIWVKNHCE